MNADNILSVWDEATDAHRERGRVWYAKAHETAHRLAQSYGVTPTVAAGVIAAMSPNTSWRANVTLATRILERGDASRGGLPNSLARAQRILDGEDPSEVFESSTYQKVATFSLGIITNGREGVCIDRHAWDVFTGIRHGDKASDRLPTRPKVAGKRYVEAAAAYNEAAAILSEREGREISGCEVEAVTWLAWRRRYWGEGAFDVEDD